MCECVYVSGSYELFPMLTLLGVGLVRIWDILMETIELHWAYSGRSESNVSCWNI